MKFTKSYKSDFTMYLQDPSEIDINLIPKIHMDLLTKSIINSVEEYYKLPGYRGKVL